MKGKVCLWVLVLFCLVLPLVLGVPVFKQGELVDLKINCVNNGGHCSAGAVCNITVLDSNDVVLVDDSPMTNSGSYFNHSFNASSVGVFKQQVFCVDGYNGYSASTFKVTPSGVEGSTGDAVVYVILLLVALVLMILCIVGGVKINGDNEFNLYGKLMSINYGKYLKMGLFFGSYLFLWFVFFLAWQVADKFLMFDFISELFRMLFLILTVLLAPLFIAFVALAFLKWVADLKLEKLAERNLPDRGGRR